MTRTLAPLAVLALLSALAAGCSDNGGSDGDTGSDEPDKPAVALTADQISEAVLQADNLGEGWTSEPSTEDEGGAPGCLADVETLTEGLEETAKGGTVFDYGDSALRVESNISVYPDEVSLEGVFDLVSSTISSCTTVSGPDGDGNMWDLALTVSDEVTEDDVDAQYSVSGSGTITAPNGDSVDVYLEQTAVRVGPNVGSITTIDTQSRTTEHAGWAEIAVERLVDVAEGEEPEATTAPAPAAAS